YGFRRQDNVITEDMPPQPGRVAYAITKTAAEEAVRAAAARHNLSYAIIRPGMIYGPNARTWTGQAFRLARKPAGFIGNGSGAAPVIFVDDVADLCLVAAHHPAADGEIFNATPDPSPTWREYISAYARLQGHQTWFGFPVVMAKLAAYGIAPFAKRGSHARSAPELIHFITHYRTFSMDKARDLLDWQPQVTLEDGIQRCVPWLRDEGLLT
ncbi:MAG: NAD(P)-dependent oxidoreductase, partial [Anaerolineae bacterium]|nr:NAD(P)-dependent oxidoreductase [Anaerolineae bacterium]